MGDLIEDQELPHLQPLILTRLKFDLGEPLPC